MSLTPSKAGTKKKPKNSTLKLFVKNNRTDATVDTITVNLGKNVKLNGKGFKYCTAADSSTRRAVTACPSGSKAGKGTANAVLGPGRAPLEFTVDAYVGSKNSIIFYVQQVGGTVRKALTGKVSKASGKYGSKIVIKIDEDLQQPGPTTCSRRSSTCRPRSRRRRARTTSSARPAARARSTTSA